MLWKPFCLVERVKGGLVESLPMLREASMSGGRIVLFQVKREMIECSMMLKGWKTNTRRVDVEGRSDSE